jgi:hypothetical protein
LDEDLLDRLVEAVLQHYAQDTPPPLLLSRFGQLHRELLKELKARFETLAAAVQAAGPERLRIVGARRGEEVVAPAERAEGLSQALKVKAADESLSGAQFSGLPLAVQVAFCVPTQPGEHIVLRTAPPFRYERIPDLGLAKPRYRALPDRYRKPGLQLKTASESDREALWKNFLAWAQDEKLDPAQFSGGEQTNALARLLAAQDADILPRLNIPADIAQLLLKRP